MRQVCALRVLHGQTSLWPRTKPTPQPSAAIGAFATWPLARAIASAALLAMRASARCAPTNARATGGA